jgi:hypothetical protein
MATENIKMTTQSGGEEIEEAHSTSAGEDLDLKKVQTYLEDDPHRAALEDNPDKPEPLTLIKILAIAVSRCPLTRDSRDKEERKRRKETDSTHLLVHGGRSGRSSGNRSSLRLSNVSIAFLPGVLLLRTLLPWRTCLRKLPVGNHVCTDMRF